MGGGDGKSSRLYCLAPVSMGTDRNLVLLRRSCHEILSGDTLTFPNTPGLPKNTSFPKIIE